MGPNGRSRLPQIRSDASPDHNQRFACRIVVGPAPGSWTRTPVRLTRPEKAHRVLAVKAGNRGELVKDTAPLRPVPREYRPAIAATSSSRAATLIRLILDPADEHRSGANQMRQWLSFREHSRRGNAASHPDRRAALQPAA